MINPEVHISSLVVHTQPEYLQSVSEEIREINDAEVYGKNTLGKIVVVVETEKQKFVTEIIDKINNIFGVLSTSLIFHQIDQQET